MPKATGDKRYKPSSVVKSNVSSAVYTPRNLRNTRERQAYRDAQILKESGAGRFKQITPDILLMTFAITTVSTDHPQQSSDTAGTTTGTTEYPPSKYGFHILTTKKKIEEGDHMRIPLPHGANPALPDADFVIMEYRGLNQGDKKATDWILMTSTPVNVTSKGPEQFMKILNNHNIHGYDSKKFSNTTEIFRNGQSLGTITEMKARALGR